LHDKYNDCKGFSTFIICCLLACDIPARFRFASYNYFDKTPKHVYVVAQIDGKDVILDGTIRRFGSEAAYKHIQDLPIKTEKMALNYLSGAEVGASKKKTARKAKKAVKKAARKTKKVEKKTTRVAKRTTKKAERKTKRAVKKAERKTKPRKFARVAAAPARAAFLAVVSLNAFKLSDKLAKAYRQNPKMVTEFWNKVGGKIDGLRNAINKRQPKNAQISIGLEAAMAAATPILIMVATLLKQLKINTDSDDAELQDGIDEGIETLNDNPEIQKEFAEMEEDIQVAKIKKPMEEYEESEEEFDDEYEEEEDDDDAEPDSNKKLYIGLGVALAAALVLPKIMKS